MDALRRNFELCTIYTQAYTQCYSDYSIAPENLTAVSYVFSKRAEEAVHNYPYQQHQQVSRQISCLIVITFMTCRGSG